MSCLFLFYICVSFVPEKSPFSNFCVNHKSAVKHGCNITSPLSFLSFFHSFFLQVVLSNSNRVFAFLFFEKRMNNKINFILLFPLYSFFFTSFFPKNSILWSSPPPLFLHTVILHLLHFSFPFCDCGWYIK